MYDFNLNFVADMFNIQNYQMPENISIKDCDATTRGDYVYLVNDFNWADPDSYNVNLYKYHTMYWKNEYPIKNVKINEPMRYYFSDQFKILTRVNDCNFRLGSDYIGFSKQWITNDISAYNVGEALSITRCFAGHILWCKGFANGWYEDAKENTFKYSNKFKSNFITIKQAKGGKNGVYDRIDWTLRLLDIYYQVINNSKSITRKELFESYDAIKSLIEYTDYSVDEKKIKKNSYETSVYRLFYAFENSRKWLLLFKDFLGFTKYFVLRDIIDLEKDSVKELAPWFPVLPNNYYNYIQNSIDFINKRKNSMIQELKVRI